MAGLRSSSYSISVVFSESTISSSDSRSSKGYFLEVSFSSSCQIVGNLTLLAEIQSLESKISSTFPSRNSSLSFESLNKGISTSKQLFGRPTASILSGPHRFTIRCPGLLFLRRVPRRISRFSWRVVRKLFYFLII